MVAIAPKIQPAPPMLEKIAEEMATPLRLEGSDRTEQRVTYLDRTWEQFKLLEQGLDGLTGLRLFYFDGKVEILMPGRNHELFKKIIAVLIEAFLFDRDIEFEALGSMTRKAEGLASGEPDESYQIGEFTLVLEVIFTRSSLNKLALYATLGIHEVWFWEDGVLKISHLRGGAYEDASHSQIPELAAIDIQALSKCILIGETSFLKARKEFLTAHPK